MAAADVPDLSCDHITLRGTRDVQGLCSMFMQTTSAAVCGARSGKNFLIARHCDVQSKSCTSQWEKVVCELRQEPAEYEFSCASDAQRQERRAQNLRCLQHAKEKRSSFKLRHPLTRNSPKGSFPLPVSACTGDDNGIKVKTTPHLITSTAAFTIPVTRGSEPTHPL